MWTLETLVPVLIALFLLGYTLGYIVCYLAHVRPYRQAQMAALRPTQRPRIWMIVSGIVLAVSILAGALNVNWKWTLAWIALAVLALHYLVTNFLRFEDEQLGEQRGR